MGSLGNLYKSGQHDEVALLFCFSVLSIYGEKSADAKLYRREENLGVQKAVEPDFEVEKHARGAVVKERWMVFSEDFEDMYEHEKTA